MERKKVEVKKLPVIVVDEIVSIISVNSSQMSCQEQEKEVFMREFEATIRTVKEEEKLIIGADTNGRVGKKKKRI